MIITIASGKGGVGKTTTTASLAVALAKLGKKTLVIDGDLSMANLAILFNLDKKKPSLHEVLSGEADIREAIYKHKTGVYVVPTSLSLEGYKKAEIELLPEVLEEVGDEFDYILIDAPAGLNREMTVHLATADKLLLVVTPEMFSIVDASRLKESAESVGTPLLGIVLNRVGRDFGELGKEEIEMLIKGRVLVEVPEDRYVRDAALKKMTVIEYKKNAPASLAYLKLASLISGEPINIEVPTIKKEESLFDRIKRWLGL
ncbi:cell division ATPase MinD [Methanocaldococcus infernus]|uniref:Cell division ATPase MinD n=1 Tax=Methanocaldococcus infernus (strain DSM 11812 / JCM 15783 / ME) TaxID=573063 RepID=D5VSB4_METIM|nr:cell division ATPase MinD [Methanocaldococcus infernus]ADG13467.1 cell division ATPase MinD [Methanocaldococcus infernus ME]